MLPTLTTRPVELPTPRDALDYLERRVLQRFTVPLRDLRVDRAGRLRHAGNMPLAQLADVPLTDVALEHLDRLAAVPAPFARRLEPDLHEHTLNELFSRQIAQVTVVVEYEHGHPEQRRVAGVVPGMRAAADERVVARRLDELGVRAVFTMHAGALEARFGVESVEVLPADVIDVSGAIRSEAWSFTRASRKPVLEVAAHLLRLVCTNGAYSNRELAGARLMAWATDKQLADFVSRQIERVLEYPKAALLRAVGIMTRTVPVDDEHDQIRALITKHAGRAHAAEALGSAVSWYDHWNAVTGAAHHVESSATRRVLEIQGGGILDRFMAAA